MTMDRSPLIQDRLVLLGTKGGPRPSIGRSNPANLISYRGLNHLIDCGYGAIRQLLAVGLQAHEIDAIFVTHHHSDHTLELGPLLYNAWIGGRRRPIDIWGPPPLRQLIDGLFQTYRFEIETRMLDEGRLDPLPLYTVREIEGSSILSDSDGLKIAAAKVCHPPLRHAFAYRFDLSDRSLVLSGDTAVCADLIELAKGADILVHEVMHVRGIEKLVASHPHARQLRGHLIASHTTTSEVGRIATAAKVGMLVLNHLVPGDDTSISNDEWLAEPRADFAGPVLLGHDLMLI